MFETQNDNLDKFIFITENLNKIIEAKAQQNLLSDAVYSENLYRDLLNCLYSWNLENANGVESNFEAIDLIDEDKKIIVQVSASCSRQKIKSTLTKEKLTDEKFQGYTIYFVFIGAQNGRVKSIDYDTEVPQ